MTSFVMQDGSQLWCINPQPDQKERAATQSTGILNLPKHCRIEVVFFHVDSRKDDCQLALLNLLITSLAAQPVDRSTLDSCLTNVECAPEKGVPLTILASMR
jgi:hypothetical protein